MQHVNDDMDELFRRAAQDYPLNTGGAAWEKVQKALEEPPAGGERPSGRNNRRHLLWLLLLLPLPWICTHDNDKGAKGISQAPAATQEKSYPQVKLTPSPVAEKNTAILPKSISGSPFTSSSTPTAAASINSKAVLFTSSRRAQNPATVEEIQTGEAEGVMDKKESEGVALQPQRVESASGAIDESLTVTEKKEESMAPAKEEADTLTAAPPAKPKEQAPRRPRFYAGVVGGADLTSVEMQKVTKLGYDLGGVIGYAINERWSVEAGLLSSEKAYYSSGEHLYKAYLLPGTQLREAEGDCRMWEVPLVVRYRFHPEKQNGWFVSAGSSSYFMKKESYDYTYYYTATGQEVKRSRSYNSDSRHLFAAAQLSGGYSRRVGRALDVRIEPYLKLPLRKVGYYDLPLTSFGVHAGITKKLF